MIETGRRVARGPDITVPARRIQHVVTEYECKLSRAPGKGPAGGARTKREHQTRTAVLPTCCPRASGVSMSRRVKPQLV